MYVVLFTLIFSYFINRVLNMVICDIYTRDLVKESSVKKCTYDIFEDVRDKNNLFTSLDSSKRDEGPFGEYHISEDTIYVSKEMLEAKCIISQFIILHETGHAIQHNTDYKPAKGYIENRIAGLVLASLVVLSVFLYILFQMPIILFACVLLFMIYIVVSLKDVICERDASMRALKVLEENGVSAEDYCKAQRFMRLCYFTYVIDAYTNLLKTGLILLSSGK